MMPNTPVVSRELAKARADLTEATRQLANYNDEVNDTIAIQALAYAIGATARAITSVALAVERLAELPACDGSHES